MFAFNPDKTIGAKDVHVYNAMLCGPQPNESLTEPSTAHSQPPADFLFQLFSVEKPNGGNGFTRNLLTFQRPVGALRACTPESAGINKQLLIDCQVDWGVATKDHFSDRGEDLYSVANSRHGNVGGEMDWVTINTGTDAWKSNGGDPVGSG